MRANQILLSAAIAAALVALPGCPPAPPPSTARPSAVGPSMDTPILGNEPAASGIYLPLSTRQVLTGAARQRALTPRATITTALNQKFAPPATQPGAASATQPATQPAEPSPLAVKYYLNGRG